VSGKKSFIGEYTLMVSLSNHVPNSASSFDLAQDERC
jgi:hypothetical protein